MMDLWKKKMNVYLYMYDLHQTLVNLTIVSAGVCICHLPKWTVTSKKNWVIII
jgi:hypothetical protein